MIDNSQTAVFAVFLSVGVGMGAPYVLLSIFGGEKISRKVSKYSLVIKRALGVILLLFAGYLFFSANSEKIFTKNIRQSGVWLDFSQELFENARKNGQSVIVDFTAKWCLNCQFNKVSVYETKEIRQILREKNILALTADLTNENIPAQNLQSKLNSKSIPFLVIFDGNDFKNPTVFYDIVTKKAIMETLREVK
jgi:thiol:disulfide interchange protein